MALAYAEEEALDDPSFTVGNRIAKRRRDLGLDQENLAAAVQVSRQLISKWERNKSLPDVKQAELLAKALECSFGWLCAIPLRSRCFMTDPLLTSLPLTPEAQLELLDNVRNGWGDRPHLTLVES